VAATERNELSAEAEQRIMEVVRSLTEDQVDRGVDLNRPMHCDSCDLDKSPLGSSQYGAYALCNDCLLELTLLLARGEIESVAEYMTRRPDDPGDLPPAPPEQLNSRSRSSLPKRSEKLLPTT